MSCRHYSLTIIGHARGGEGGQVRFSQWGPVGTTEPPYCLCTDSEYKDPDTPLSFSDPDVC